MMNREIPLAGQCQTLVGRTLDEANMLFLKLQGMSRGDWNARVCFRDDRGKVYQLDTIRLSREALDQVNTDPDFIHAVADGAIGLPYDIPMYQPPAEE